MEPNMNQTLHWLKDDPDFNPTESITTVQTNDVCDPSNQKLLLP